MFLLLKRIIYRLRSILTSKRVETEQYDFDAMDKRWTDAL
jgi:hypothetical protein